jgi:hypothetical protein
MSTRRSAIRIREKTRRNKYIKHFLTIKKNGNIQIKYKWQYNKWRRQNRWWEKKIESKINACWFQNANLWN